MKNYLPELPKSVCHNEFGSLFNADQMEAYASQAIVASGWRNIESGPKSGNYCLLATDRSLSLGRYHRGKWCVFDGGPMRPQPVYWAPIPPLP